MKNKILYGFVIISFVSLWCLAYSYFIEPNRLVVTSETLKIKNWNPAFDGLKIVMLGDLHGGSHGVTEEKIRAIVLKINEQDPDVVVMLGDYVSEWSDGSLKMPVETIAANLAGINATYGVFAVLGNHDGDYDDDRVAAALSGNGYKVLQNEVAPIEKNGQRIRIFGMKDHLKLAGGWLRISADSKKYLSTTGSGDMIVLQHSPDILPVIAGEYSVSPDLRLILAAHTHGGQVWFPILGRMVVPSGFGQKYAYGHVLDKGVDMFVTSGIGSSVLPFRFMVPPEIVSLTIRSE
ncbi:MAG: metallophosphoesterase [Chloracidobacterium sp.]|nr:metallophosphoesterase [Chloracidobacterium sp.]